MARRNQQSPTEHWAVVADSTHRCTRKQTATFCGHRIPPLTHRDIDPADNFPVCTYCEKAWRKKWGIPKRNRNTGLSGQDRSLRMSPFGRHLNKTRSSPQQRIDSKPEKISKVVRIASAAAEPDPPSVEPIKSAKSTHDQIEQLLNPKRARGKDARVRHQEADAIDRAYRAHERSESVRTVSGGLPGLGKRHR
jgi:hypothetical protein